MKNATAFFLLIIFGFNLGGSYVILKIQQHQIRREIIHQIKEGISEKDLTSITVSPKTKTNSLESPREFAIKDKKDIVRVENLNENTTVYHCISDSQETNLIAKCNKIEKRKDKNKTNSVKP